MGSATTDKTTRQRLRQRLLQAGEDPEMVEIAVEALRARQGRVQVPQGVPVRRGAGLASTKAIADARARFEAQAGSLETPEVTPVESPDDKGYRPSPGDGLLTGPGRGAGRDCEGGASTEHGHPLGVGAARSETGGQVLTCLAFPVTCAADPGEGSTRPAQG